VKTCVDSIVWLKVDKSIMNNDEDLFICAIYVPPDKNVFIENMTVMYLM
jgi:hypothetical protein